MPRFGLALTKKAVNQAEDLMGFQAAQDSAFGPAQLGARPQRGDLERPPGRADPESIKAAAEARRPMMDPR